MLRSSAAVVRLTAALAVSYGVALVAASVAYATPTPPTYPCGTSNNSYSEGGSSDGL
ncbi:hypothetical protein HK405_011610, partial [Cladochytrium tenue]